MDDFVALDISAAGMRAQRTRLQVIAENLANQQTVGPNGPYRRKEVVLQAVPVESTAAGATFEQSLADAKAALQTVAAPTVVEDPAEPIRQYQPGHPFADAQGYVAYPNISTFREMTDMIEASRSYEANLAAAKTTQDLLASALELIRR
ncbi:MAG: flagellar basal body rod protein FlgC [bacterium]|nr:flagellar basal body rod protein FlgC [bacterium]